MVNRTKMSIHVEEMNNWTFAIQIVVLEGDEHIIIYFFFLCQPNMSIWTSKEVAFE